MSEKGKMKRGEAWWNQRDREGNLPEGIANDPNKMIEVDFFLDHQKKPVVKNLNDEVMKEPVKEKGKK